jgi:hypothetical protein
MIHLSDSLWDFSANFQVCNLHRKKFPDDYFSISIYNTSYFDYSQGYSAFFGLFKSQWQALSEAISTVATRLAENQMTSRNTEQQENIDEGASFNEKVEVDVPNNEETSDPYECVLS